MDDEQLVKMDERTMAVIERARELAGDPVPAEIEQSPMVLWSLVSAGDLIPGWWTPARDAALDKFWRGASHISSALYNAQAKLCSIPWRIVARDPSITRHVDQAEEMTYLLQYASEFGETFDVAKEKATLDMLTQDNGQFYEILGDGRKDGPIIGRPVAAVHRAAAYCTRTSNPEFPVVYQDPRSSTRYKLHYTRVIYGSQMASSNPLANGVGLCGLSRAIYFARYLHDIMIYRAEEMGSRPKSRVLVGKGILPEAILAAFGVADTMMNNQGLRNYSKTVAVGSENTEIDLESVDMSTLTHFVENEAVTLGMFGISMALGMAAGDLWPGSAAAGKADGAIQNLQARGKLPAQTISFLNKQFSFKYLPPHLEMVHDFQDDEQDQQTAIIRDIRSRQQQRNLASGATTGRTTRQMMVRDGDITREQMEYEELREGRLEDGSPAGSLLYSADPIYSAFLDFSAVSTNVLNPAANDPNVVLAAIADHRQLVFQALATTTGARNRKKLIRCSAVLDWLQKMYEDAQMVAVREAKAAAELTTTNAPEPRVLGDRPREGGENGVNKMISLLADSPLGDYYGQLIDAEN